MHTNIHTHIQKWPRNPAHAQISHPWETIDETAAPISALCNDFLFVLHWPWPQQSFISISPCYMVSGLLFTGSEENLIRCGSLQGGSSPTTPHSPLGRGHDLMETRRIGDLILMWIWYHDMTGNRYDGDLILWQFTKPAQTQMIQLIDW